MRALRPLLTGFFLLTVLVPAARAKSQAVPRIEDTPEMGRLLILPADLREYLRDNIPGFKIPLEQEFDPAMLKYYHSRLIGIHPAIAWGDFNKDKKLDYAILVVTAETPWGPQMELVILNGLKKKGGDYELFRMGEIYNFKKDYISFQNDKLLKGRYRGGAWFIKWNPKKALYTKLKS